MTRMQMWVKRKRLLINSFSYHYLFSYHFSSLQNILIGIFKVSEKGSIINVFIRKFISCQSLVLVIVLVLLLHLVILVILVHPVKLITYRSLNQLVGEFFWFDLKLDIYKQWNNCCTGACLFYFCHLNNAWRPGSVLNYFIYI